MAKVEHINGVGWAIEKLVEHYKTGEIKGLMFQLLDKNGEFHNCRSGDLTYIEMLGLIEAAKDDFRITRADNVE